jgi:hypothetical protein
MSKVSTIVALFAALRRTLQCFSCRGKSLPATRARQKLHFTSDMIFPEEMGAV